MCKTIDLEKEFYKVAKELETKTAVRDEFLRTVTSKSEDWIDQKFRWEIMGLEDEA